MIFLKLMQDKNLRENLAGNLPDTVIVENIIT